ncbi:DUF565 domain-containing protein [Ancylothrix sp. C2]|uniref:DUF565 domain-containing protein n=1 Tax=Ancylothrix sp. D3o TaxID=2953691 RepID=UPI0021BADF06|nr:DUF565 domain-containing protein [Ancylothrix sp. D3o]MCT7948547.1 DUF565 domain-containing protein [Ancylothrix sp. D3o]
MQNTRFSTLLDTTSRQIGRWLSNPWRRLSLLIISLLFGYFFASAISTVAGQQANLDISVAAFLLVFTEATSRFVYGAGRRVSQSLFFQMLNTLKIGMTYSLFVEAFKLGS